MTHMQHHEEEELDLKRIALRTDLQNVRIPLEGVVVDICTIRTIALNEKIDRNARHAR
jgi:hypothetical protein